MRVLGCLLLWCTPVAAQAILPPPPVPAGNPQTPAKVRLGQALFWDEQLSSSRSVACGTCHSFAHGGADARAATSLHPGLDGRFGTPDDVHGSPGVTLHDAAGNLLADPRFGLQPLVTARRAGSPINAAYAAALFADGRASEVFRDPLTGAVVLASGGALESQIAEPPVNATEMAHLGRTWADLAADLPGLVPLRLASQVPAALQQFVAGQTYAGLFQQVFGSPGVTPVRIVFALAAYERSLVSDQSPFDLYLAGRGALTFQQQAGLATFQQRCAGCHQDLAPTVLTAGPVLDDYRNIGLRPLAEDRGRFAITAAAADLGRFRVPGLRNVALRAPYFHTGGIASLGEVVDFYARGGDVHDNQDPLVPAIVGHITLQDRAFLPALLQSLTDPRVAAEAPPFDRPRLWSEGAFANTAFGAGTAGSAGPVPRIAAPVPAFAGNPRFALGLDRALATVPCLLVLDTAGSVVPQSFLGHSLYLGLSPAAQAWSLVTGSAGTAASLMPVPPQAGLAGLQVYAQWFAADPGGPSGFASTGAVAVNVF